MPTNRPDSPPSASSDSEHCLVDAIDIDTHLHGGVAVLCGGPHRPAELAVAQENKQQQSTRDADTCNQDIERTNRSRADLKTDIGQLAR
jgi:hypothetical protein